MRNVAEKLVEPVPSHEDGYVVRLEGLHLIVRSQRTEAETRARRALSCLVAPNLGDRVLLARLDDGTTFVLAVLEREEEDAEVRLSTDRSMTIEAPAGRVDIVGAEGVALVTAGKLTATFESLSLAGERILANAKKSTIVGQVVEAIADVAAQRFKRAFRHVTEVDQLRAGHVDYQVDKALRIHSENAFVTAEQIVKLDGENIHLG
jgi:hypothetical protein